MLKSCPKRRQARGRRQRWELSTRGGAVDRSASGEGRLVEQVFFFFGRGALSEVRQIEDASSPVMERCRE